jgi:hypothetical protein
MNQSQWFIIPAMIGIDKVVEALREEMRRIDNALSALEGRTGRSMKSRRPTTGNGRRKRRGRRLSTAARRRISIAAKARWAAAKKAGKSSL